MRSRLVRLVPAFFPCSDWRPSVGNVVTGSTFGSPHAIKGTTQLAAGREETRFGIPRNTRNMTGKGPEPWQNQIKALTFDVFGTCVDWRSSVQEALKKEAAAKISSAAFAHLPTDVQSRARSLTDQDWAVFAQEWRSSYGRFTRHFVPGETEWKDIDTHHRDSLVEILTGWQLDGFYSPEEVERLSRTWHFLKPWPDTSQGIHMLGRKLVTATLSNGNRALLKDLNDHGDLGFQRLISAEDFRAYKPNRAVYLGACESLGLAPQQVAMVAAHLGDLEAARACGLRTAYVGRPDEEEWKPGEDRYEGAKQWVDIWVAEGEGGFVEVAKKLQVV